MKFRIQANVDVPAICNQLLETEAAAIEAYDNAITALVDGSRRANVLEHLKERHLRTFKNLSSTIRASGVEPSVDPDGPQVLTYFAQQTPDLNNSPSPIDAFIRGEKHGRHLYEEATEKIGTLANVRSHIEENVLPLITENIVILRTLDEKASP